MCVQDLVFFTNTTDDVDVSVGNDDCFGVVWQVVEVVELLNLV